MKALFICDNKEQWELYTNLFKAHFPKIPLVCAIKGEDALNYLQFDGPFSMFLIDAELKDEERNLLSIA